MATKAAPPSETKKAKTPRRKPPSSRPTAANSPVDILSNIRKQELQGDPAIKAHNDSIHSLIRGISVHHPSFTAAFFQGWRPIRDAGQAGRPKPADLGAALKLSSAELRTRPKTRRLEEQTRELALWLLAEDNAPGVEDWCWEELKSGIVGAERVVKLWDALQRREHLHLRTGPNALDRASKSMRTASPNAKPPGAVFGAYIAAWSILHAADSSPPPFADVLPTLVTSFSPSLRRADERGNFGSRIASLPAESSPLAHAWIRQVSLFQMWHFDNPLRTPGYEIVRLAKAYFRTSSPALAWEMWELIREGVENEDVKWIDESRWEAKGRERWLGEEEQREEEKAEEAERTGRKEVEKPVVAFAAPDQQSTIDGTPSSTLKALSSTLDAPPSRTLKRDLPPALLTPALLAPFISGFTRAFLFDQATQIWTWLPSRNLSPGVVSWTALLQGYASRGDVQAVEAVFSDMVAAEVEPDVWAWMERISVRFEAKQPDEGLELAEHMSKDKSLKTGLVGGHFPGTVYSRLIHGLLSCHRLEQAEGIMRQMEEEGVPVTIHTINAFLVYHTRRKKVDLSNVIRCLQLIAEKGLEADVFTFTMVLQALLATGQRDATSKLVKIMETTRINPSVTTYGAIINSLANSAEPDQLKAAVELIDEMERSGMATNEIIYTSVIQGFLRAITGTQLAAHGDDEHPYFTAALALKDRMERRGLSFNRIGYNAIIAAALSLQSEWGVQLALRTFRDMESRPGTFGKGSDGKQQVDRAGKTVTPADTWYVLLDGFANMGDWSRARALVAEMDKSGFKARSKPLARLVDKVQRGGYISV